MANCHLESDVGDFGAAAVTDAVGRRWQKRRRSRVFLVIIDVNRGSHEVSLVSRVGGSRRGAVLFPFVGHVGDHGRGSVAVATAVARFGRTRSRSQCGDGCHRLHRMLMLLL